MIEATLFLEVLRVDPRAWLREALGNSFKIRETLFRWMGHWSTGGRRQETGIGNLDAEVESQNAEIKRWGGESWA
jgi:hypothetical protein